MSLPYFPMFPADFEADTSHLTLAEDGAYNRLLRLCWLGPGCCVPDDAEWLARRLRVDAKTFAEVVAPVIAEFFKRRRGKLYNPRLTAIFAETSAKHKRRVQAGRKGGRSAKPLGENEKTLSNAKAMPKQPEPEPEPYRYSGGGSARARENGDAQDPHLTVLDAAGIDWRKDVTGKVFNSVERGYVDRWRTSLGLDDDHIFAVLRETAASKRDGPATSLRYFDKAMARRAGELAQLADPLNPQTVTPFPNRRTANVRDPAVRAATVEATIAAMRATYGDDDV